MESVNKLKTVLRQDRSMVTLVFGAFLGYVGGSMILPFFPLYVQQMGLSGVSMSVLFSLYYVGRVSGGTLAGWLYRRIGARKVVVLLFSLQALCMVGYALLTAWPLIFLCRFLQGLSAVGITVFVRTTVNQLSTNDARGLANGFISSAEGAGMILGPVVGGALSGMLTVQTPFLLVAVFLGLALALLLTMHLPGRQNAATQLVHPQARRQRFDRRLAAFGTVHFLEMSSLAIFVLYFPLYASGVMHWTAWGIGLAFTIIGVASMIAGPLIGKVSDILKDRVLVAVVGLALVIVEVLAFLGSNSYWVVYLGMVFGGMGGAAYFDALFAQIGDVTRPEERSLFTGTVLSFSEIGSIVTPLVAGYLMSHYSIHFAFYLDILLVAAAIAIFLLYRQRAVVHARDAALECTN